MQGAWEGTVYLQGLVAEGQTWEGCVHLLGCRVGSPSGAPWEVRAARTLSGTQRPLSWARAGENTGVVCPSLGVCRAVSGDSALGHTGPGVAAAAVQLILAVTTGTAPRQGS